MTSSAGKSGLMRFGIAAHFLHRFAHRGEIDDGGNASEILQQDARGHEGDFFLRDAGSPRSESLDVFGVNEAIVFKAKQVFE